MYNHAYSFTSNNIYISLFKPYHEGLHVSLISPNKPYQTGILCYCLDPVMKTIPYITNHHPKKRKRFMRMIGPDPSGEDDDLPVTQTNLLFSLLDSKLFKALWVTLDFRVCGHTQDSLRLSR